MTIVILDDIKKNSILKRGIGIESDKICKQVRVQKVWKQVRDQKSIETSSRFMICRTKINSKAFVIPILTVI